MTKMKIGTPAAPALRDVYTNSDFFIPLGLKLRAFAWQRDRQTDGRARPVLWTALY